MDNEIKAQGLMDLFKFTDKELIEKILKIMKTVEVKDVGDNITRISFYLKNK